MCRAFSISFSVVVIATLFLGFLSLVGFPSSGAKLQRVDADFNAIGSSLKTYQLDAGCFPSDAQGLTALVNQPTTTPLPKAWKKIATRVPTDPWETEYQYHLLPEGDSRGFELLSAGKDGLVGTEDDLSSLDPK
jgi:general secretion pathway protein G